MRYGSGKRGRISLIASGSWRIFLNLNQMKCKDINNNNNNKRLIKQTLIFLTLKNASIGGVLEKALSINKRLDCLDASEYIPDPY